MLLINLCFSGVFITVGSITAEGIQDQYFHKQPCAKARELIVLKWAMIGFLLTTGYKEILLSKLINIEYEKGIDSVEDVLISNKPVVLDGTSGISNLVKSDPRKQVKEIEKRLKPYKAVRGAPPIWVINGYS